MKDDRTRTLLFGIFVTTGASLTAPELIALAAPLGISASNVKSHLSRMVADGALTREGPARRARYAPSIGQARVVRSIVDRLEDARQPWDRTWYALSLPMPAPRAARRSLRADLWLDGFRLSPGGLFVRPVWPQPWADARLQWYLRVPGAMALRGLAQSGAIHPEDLYELDALDAEARRLAAYIRRHSKTLPSARRAFALRLKVGGLMARLVGRDPRLPPALWGARKGMQDLKRTFTRFDARVSPIAARLVREVLAK